jgi:hypothetical protein
MSWRGELIKAGIYSTGNRVTIPGLNVTIGKGNAYYLDGTNGSNSYDGRTANRPLLTLAAVLSKVTTLQNDVVYVPAASTAINFASKVTWNKSLCHIVGIGAANLMNQRARFGHNANFATLMDITGYGNSFSNLYFMYGRGSATNTNLLTVTGDRNSFVNCHFGGPMHATEGSTAGFNLVTILGTENYFKDCTFGISTIDVAAAITAVKFGGSGYDPRTIFDNCTFIFRGASGGAGSYFVQTVSGVGEAFALFRGNTSFLNLGATAFTLAIDGAGSGAQKILFSQQPLIVGCTDVIGAAYETGCFLPASSYTANALGNGLAVNPDVV